MIYTWTNITGEVSVRAPHSIAVVLGVVILLLQEIAAYAQARPPIPI